MIIELECCGFNPTLIKVIADVKAKISICENKILIESSNEHIGCLTIKNKSIYNSRWCYLNIFNPIHYLVQYKLKNDDIYFYDDGFLWVDIDIKNTCTSDIKIKLEKHTVHINGSNLEKYTISTLARDKIFIRHHDIPAKRVFRYKMTNVASQLFYSVLIMCLAIVLIMKTQENILLYLCGLIILYIISGIKIYKYLSSKSTKDI